MGGYHALRRWAARGAYLIPMAAVGLMFAGLASRTAVERFRTPPAYVPIEDGEELVLVFIASSTCRGVRNPGLRTAVRRILKDYRALNRERGARFIAIGVATDWDIRKGMRLLEHFGRFDEVLLGRGWLNSGVVKYVWGDLPGGAGIPQIVLVRRQIRVTDAGLRVMSEEVLFRKIGGQNIVNWARARSDGA